MCRQGVIDLTRSSTQGLRSLSASPSVCTSTRTGTPASTPSAAAGSGRAYINEAARSMRRAATFTRSASRQSRTLLVAQDGIRSALNSDASFNRGAPGMHDTQFQSMFSGVRFLLVNRFPSQVVIVSWLASRGLMLPFGESQGLWEAFMCASYTWNAHLMFLLFTQKL
jgi:hypothetical protein